MRSNYYVKVGLNSFKNCRSGVGIHLILGEVMALITAPNFAVLSKAHAAAQVKTLRQIKIHSSMDFSSHQIYLKKHFQNPG